MNQPGVKETVLAHLKDTRGRVRFSEDRMTGGTSSEADVTAALLSLMDNGVIELVDCNLPAHAYLFRRTLLLPAAPMDLFPDAGPPVGIPD